MRSVRPPISVPHPMGNAGMRDELPLRFRGPGAAPQLYKASGVHAVQAIVASHHFVCEASCVSRRRSCDHKVPRRRARFAAVLRGSARSGVNAGSPFSLSGACRCLGGKAQKLTWSSAWSFVRSRHRRIYRCEEAMSCSATCGARQSNNAFERTVQALAVARGRRGGQFASAARSHAHRAAAQRER